MEENNGNKNLGFTSTVGNKKYYQRLQNFGMKFNTLLRH